MKKLIVVAALAYWAWQYYQENLAVKPAPMAIESSSSRAHGALSTTASVGSQPTWPTHTAVSTPASNTSGFRCDGRQHCSQMRSREEAEFFLRHCPNTKMDGDGDGIPCERQF